MKLNELAKNKIKQVGKVMEGHFNRNINVSRLSMEQAKKLLTKTTNIVAEVKSTVARHTSHTNPAYLQAIMVKEALETYIKEGTADIKNPYAGGTADSVPGASMTTTSGGAGGVSAMAAGDIADPKDAKDPVPMNDGEEGEETEELEEAPGSYAQKGDLEKYRWNDINQGMMDAGMNSSRIAKVLGKLQGKALTGKKYQWGDINQAMLDAGMNSRRCANIMSKLQGKALSESKQLNEADVEEAQVVLAAQDIVDRVQKMYEDTAEMQYKDLSNLAQTMKSELGINQTQTYYDSTNTALSTLVKALETAKQELTNAMAPITGEETISPDTFGDNDAEATPDLDLDADDTAAPEVAVDDDGEIDTPDLDPDLGRERR